MNETTAEPERKLQLPMAIKDRQKAEEEAPITVTEEGRIGGEEAKAQRDTMARELGPAIFEALKDKGFYEEVRVRIYWKHFRSEMFKESKAAKRKEPLSYEAVMFCHDLVNQAGGDLEHRDEPEDTAVWYILCEIMALGAERLIKVQGQGEVIANKA